MQERYTMATPKVFESEYRFCLLLWENEPIKSTELAKLCEAELGWKKATTYTVIKRLTERGVIKSDNAVITSLVSKEEVQAAEVEEVVEKTFAGNIPQFFAAFSRGRKLSKSEIDEIQKMIDEM